MSEPHKINPISFVLDNDVTQRLALKQNNLNNSTLLLGIGSNITNINYNTLSNLPDLSTYIKESTLLQNINSLYQDTNTNPTIRRNNTYTCNISNSSKITTSNLLVNDSINFSGYVYSNAEPFNMPPLDPYNSILTNYITITILFLIVIHLQLVICLCHLQMLITIFMYQLHNIIQLQVINQSYLIQM